MFTIYFGELNRVHAIIFFFSKNTVKSNRHFLPKKISYSLTVSFNKIVLNHELCSQQRLTVGNFPHMRLH
jgi:hypothetical protein